jgi:archaellum component FlaC
LKITHYCYLIFADDLSDTRMQLTEVNRRYHELEIELRRLENEREELTAAYKEAEAVSSKFKPFDSEGLYNSVKTNYQVKLRL